MILLKTTAPGLTQCTEYNDTLDKSYSTNFGYSAYGHRIL